MQVTNTLESTQDDYIVQALHDGYIGLLEIPTDTYETYKEVE